MIKFCPCRLLAPNKISKEDKPSCGTSAARAIDELHPLQLYEPLENGEHVSSTLKNSDSSIDIHSFEDSEKDCSSFRKEMDVLLCGDTDSQQIVSQLSCCSEPRSLTSPSFSLQGEDFVLDQAGHIPISEFPLQDQNLPPFKSGRELDSTGKSAFTSIPSEGVHSINNLNSPEMPSSNTQHQNSFRKSLATDVKHGLGEMNPVSQVDKQISDPAVFPPQTHTIGYNELESLPSFPSSSLLENVATGLYEQQGQTEATTVLSVDAKVVGATGEIRFQRNIMGGVKIFFPPTTAEKAIKFDDLINLFSLQEVRQAFCAESKEEEIIQQLVQQGLGSSGVPASGRDSAMSHTSSLDLPNSLLSPLSVSDSWSWEISQLLSGDENSNQGDEGDNRSELNTPIVTLPPSGDRSELNTPIVMSPSGDHRCELNTPIVTLRPKGIDEETSVKYASSLPTLSAVKNYCNASDFQPETFTLNDRNSDNGVTLPQRVFTPLQVQIPEETDTTVRMSRTLHSCNTYFEELSLGISPVLELDPNVATVRMSCPSTEDSQLCMFKNETGAVPSQQDVDSRPGSVDTENNGSHVTNVPEDDDCDIKEVAVDIIIDDGKMNWLKLLPDPTDEFIKKISHKCYKCHICSKSFNFRFQVQRHIKINHSTARPFICAVCGATFSIKYYLTRHMKHHDPNNKFPCRVCDRKFTRHYQLIEHEESHKDPSSLKCSDCGKQSNSRSAFNVHRSICSGSLQSYVCDICGKSYAGLTALNHHRARHESRKEFKCTMCESAFHTQWQLVKHTKRHAIQGLYICRFCSLAFNSTSNLKKHMAKCPALTVNKVVKKEIEGKNHPVTMMSAPMPIIIEHVDSMIPANIGVTKKNLTDDQPLSAEKPKKKLIYVVKNASNIPVQSVLSAVFGESQPQTAHTAQSAVPSKPGVIKLKRHHDDEISQQVVIKGSDGKENMIFLDMSTPVSVVSTEAPEESEDVDDPTWNPSISDKPVSRGAALSQLKRARSAVKNSVRTLRLPKPLKPRAVKERIETTLPRRQTQITEDDPNYAVMMEKFSKPVSISTLKRHGLYKSRPNGYKINAPYKKDVAPYIDKISETEYQCKICLTAKFRWNYKAEIHILEHLDWRPFECDVCGRAFTQNQYLTKHKRLHFPDDTNFMCEVCGKGFQRRYYLTYHMDEHFDRTYTCAECGRKFSRRQKHDEHVRYHHKCHYSVCDVCGQTMRTTALSRHRKQHGEKHMRKKRESSLQTPGSCQGTWLTCNVCGRAFRSVRERDEHEAEHGNSLLPFQCEECVVYFKSKRTLNNHIFHAHGCVTDEESQIVGEVVTQEEECEVATRVLDELSSTIVVNIPGDL